MIKNISELQELIIWAKSQKLKSLSIGEIKFEFSDLAALESLPDLAAQDSKPYDLSVPPSSPRLPDGNTQANEEEELLFYSTR